MAGGRIGLYTSSGVTEPSNTLGPGYPAGHAFSVSRVWIIVEFDKGHPMQKNLRKIPALIGQLFRTVRCLDTLFPERPFTPDGHLVGSIGEVVAAYTYGLILEKCSNKGFDAKTRDRKTVEIKLTGGTSVAVSSDDKTPKTLIVLKLDSETGFTEIYCGKFPRDLWKRKRATKRRTKSLRLGELTRMNEHSLKQEHPLKELNELFEAADLP